MEPQENNPPIAPRRWAGLGTRILTGVVLGVIAFICIWQGGIAFTAFAMLLALVMKKEWDALMVTPSLVLRAGGYAYVILPTASLLWLRNLAGETGIGATVALVAIISATDIGAYFVGRRFGKNKLSPTISPGKTWEGLFGGVGAALITALLLSRDTQLPHPFITALWVGPLLALLAQAGDLFESSLKREAGVKDSGTLLPGHGGLLDRFDGYMFTAPVFALIVHSMGAL